MADAVDLRVSIVEGDAIAHGIHHLTGGKFLIDIRMGIVSCDAVALIVNGYAGEVLQRLPMEFAVEARKLLAVNLEGSIG